MHILVSFLTLLLGMVSNDFHFLAFEDGFPTSKVFLAQTFPLATKLSKETKHAHSATLNTR